MLYVLEWPKNRNWLALEFPDRGVGAGLAPARSGLAPALSGLAPAR